MKLFDYQEEAIRRLRAAYADGYRKVILQAVCGCHEADQKLLTYHGDFIRAADVQVGDRLMGPDSTPRTVHALCRGRGPMVRVVPHKGKPFVVNDQHILTVTLYGQKGKGKLIDVTVQDWLGWPPSRRRDSQLVRSKGINFPDPFTPDDRPIDPYFLGVLLGDGAIKYHVAVCKPDPEIVHEVHHQAQKYGLIVRPDNEGESRVAYHLTTGKRGGYHDRNPLLRHLAQLGLRGLDSSNKFIPKAYLVAPRADRLQLLAGVLDTDGHLASGGYDLISKSPQLAQDIALLARGLGFYVKESIKEGRCQNGFVGTYHRLAIYGGLDAIPCRIPRKQAGPRRQTKANHTSGFIIEPIGEGDFYGFTLDGDQRYLLDDLTITHNSGKTVVACAIMASAIQKEKRCLFFAHARELIHQCSRKLDEFGLRHGIIMAGHGYTPAAIQVVSKDTFASRALRLAVMDNPPGDMIIIDEAHGTTGRVYRQILQQYPSAYFLGLTATPATVGGKGLGDFWEKIVVTASSQELIAANRICPITVWAPYRPDLKGVKRGKNGDYVSAHLAKRMDKPQLVGDIITHWKRLGQDRPTVVTACSVAHSQNIVAEFIRNGVRAAHVDGSTLPEARIEIFKRFEEGHYQVVSSCNVLHTGIDFPWASCGIMARPTRSFVLFRQASGRIARAFAGSPSWPAKVDARLLDHAGNVYLHGFPDEDIEWTLETTKKISDQVKERRKSGQMDTPIHCPKCHALTKRGPTCGQCGFRFPPKKTPPHVRRQDGVLVRMEGGDYVPLTYQDHVRLWRKALYIASSRNGAVAMAAAIFKAETGQFPWNIQDLPDVPPISQIQDKVADALPKYQRR